MEEKLVLAVEEAEEVAGYLEVACFQIDQNPHKKPLKSHKSTLTFSIQSLKSNSDHRRNEIE